MIIFVRYIKCITLEKIAAFSELNAADDTLSGNPEISMNGSLK
jgi:hypothetical protein